jgi:hypothetical protein
MRGNNMLLNYLHKVATEGWEKHSSTKILNYWGEMEKRKHPRIGIENISVDVADEVGAFQGMVSEISRFGVCLTNLPKRLNLSVKKMTIVVSVKGQHFKMNARPRWYTDDGATKSVGAEILKTPWGWTEFVIGLEPIIHKDVWSEIRL